MEIGKILRDISEWLCFKSRPYGLSKKQIETIENMSEVLKEEKYIVGMERLNIDNMGLKSDLPDFQKPEKFLGKLEELNNTYYEQTGYEIWD